MSGAEGSLCEWLRDESLAVWESLHEHPFLVELAAGTLPPEKFRFYLEQNLMYLPEYSRTIAIGAARSRDDAELRSFGGAIDNIVRVEIPENEAFLAQIVELGAEDRGGAAEMAPGTLAYTSFLIAAAFKGGPLEVMTAIMPCAWSYGDIARRLQGEAVDHPVYAKWLAFFASDEYSELVERMKAELDALARREGTDPAHLSETFRNGARLELGFWEMAYGLEQWPDAAAVAAPAQALATTREGTERNE
ncbi:MAG: thiaminase II [Solirubrobacterales bacterium]